MYTPETKTSVAHTMDLQRAQATQQAQARNNYAFNAERLSSRKTVQMQVTSSQTGPLAATRNNSILNLLPENSQTQRQQPITHHNLTARNTNQNGLRMGEPLSNNPRNDIKATGCRAYYSIEETISLSKHQPVGLDTSQTSAYQRKRGNSFSCASSSSKSLDYSNQSHSGKLSSSEEFGEQSHNHSSGQSSSSCLVSGTVSDQVSMPGSASSVEECRSQGSEHGADEYFGSSQINNSSAFASELKSQKSSTQPEEDMRELAAKIHFHHLEGLSLMDSMRSDEVKASDLQETVVLGLKRGRSQTKQNQTLSNHIEISTDEHTSNQTPKAGNGLPDSSLDSFEPVSCLKRSKPDIFCVDASCTKSEVTLARSFSHESSIPIPIITTPPPPIPKPEPQVSLITKGTRVASWLQAECVSKQMSISHGQQALRFTCLNGHNFYSPVDTLEELYSLLHSKNGKLLPEELNQITWCSKCQSFYQKAQQAARRVELKVLSGLYEPSISIKCNQSGHIFKISYSKKLQCLSCLDCRKSEREILKEKLKREEMIRHEQSKLLQGKLFEEAKLRMTESIGTPMQNSNPTGIPNTQTRIPQPQRHYSSQQQRQQQSTYYASSSSSRSNRPSSSRQGSFTSSSQSYPWSTSQESQPSRDNESSCRGRHGSSTQIDYYASMERRINKTAAKLTASYMKSMQRQQQMSQSTRATETAEERKALYDRIFLVYKFQETPLHAILVGMQTMLHSSQVNQYFKRLAKQLHPDKNQHPQAKEAFQKLQQAMESFRQQQTRNLSQVPCF